MERLSNPHTFGAVLLEWGIDSGKAPLTEALRRTLGKAGVTTRHPTHILRLWDAKTGESLGHLVTGPTTGGVHVTPEGATAGLHRTWQGVAAQVHVYRAGRGAIARDAITAAEVC